jgi:hypothetical protein
MKLRVYEIGVGQNPQARGQVAVLQHQREEAAFSADGVYHLRDERFELAELAHSPVRRHHEERLAASRGRVRHVVQTREAEREVAKVYADFQARRFESREQPLAHPLGVAVAVAYENVEGGVRHARPLRRARAQRHLTTRATRSRVSA